MNEQRVVLMTHTFNGGDDTNKYVCVSEDAAKKVQIEIVLDNLDDENLDNDDRQFILRSLKDGEIDEAIDRYTSETGDDFEIDDDEKVEDPDPMKLATDLARAIRKYGLGDDGEISAAEA